MKLEWHAGEAGRRVRSESGNVYIGLDIRI